MYTVQREGAICAGILVNLDGLQSLVSRKSQESQSWMMMGRIKAPFVTKKIDKVEICPDMTHLRIYFDHLNFSLFPDMQYGSK